MQRGYDRLEEVSRKEFEGSVDAGNVSDSELEGVNGCGCVITDFVLFQELKEWFLRRMTSKILRKRDVQRNLADAYEKYRLSRGEFVEKEIRKVVGAVLTSEVRREVSAELVKRYRGFGLEIFSGSAGFRPLNKERDCLLGELSNLSILSRVGSEGSFGDVSESVGSIGSVRQVGWQGTPCLYVSLEGVAGYTFWDEEQEEFGGVSEFCVGNSQFMFSEGSRVWWEDYVYEMCPDEGMNGVEENPRSIVVEGKVLANRSEYLDKRIASF